MTDFPKTTRYKAATKLACELANIAPARFNEAVHSGAYDCAPDTVPGKTRAFDVNDIIALRRFSRLLERGHSIKSAGQEACELRAFLRDNPDADLAYKVFPSVGSTFITTPFDVTLHKLPLGIDPNEREITDVDVMHFHFERGRIVHEIENAAAVVGG